MKKKILNLICATCFIFLAFQANAQENIPFESSNKGTSVGYTNRECFDTWSTAGSPTYKNSRHPYVVVNAIADLGLQIDGSDNTGKLEERILEFKTNFHQNDFYVIYFPAGTYTFKNKINLTTIEINGVAFPLTDVI